ncbi:MAG TPA: DUF3426 domain-containing protein [Rhizomicrobium sp.]|jgi:predicted Zn finger-like uncharacterized protein
MILTCPQCATQYRVDAAKFPASGRSVRCAKCGHRWHQDGPRAEAPVAAAPEPVFTAPPEQPEPVPEPVRVHVPEPEAPRRAAYVAPAVEDDDVAGHEAHASVEPPEIGHGPERASWGRVIGMSFGWVALVAVVLVIGFSAFVWRQQMAHAWPRSASLYAMLGLKVNPVGIDFINVTHKRESEDGQAVLAIQGKLVNLSGHKVAVPPIEVTFTDGAHHQVLKKSFAPGVAELEPGQIASFLARLSSPPAGATHMDLRFARP